jgi:DNA repair protein RAD16
LSGTVLNNYAHIFDILIRLRQAVDHPYLVIYSDTQSTAISSNVTYQHDPARIDPEPEITGDCDICHEPIENQTHSACGHQFCKSCITDYMESIDIANEATTGRNKQSITCPTCMEPLTLNLKSNEHINGGVSVWNPNLRRRKSILDKIDMKLFQSSTKLEALMEVFIELLFLLSLKKICSGIVHNANKRSWCKGNCFFTVR